MDKKSAIIGIDLGTTYTRVAVWHEGQAKVIPNKEGRTVHPSYVSFTEKGSCDGDSSHQQQEFPNMKNTVFDLKRMVGRGYDEFCRETEKIRQFWPFQVTCKDSQPAVKIGGKPALNAQELVSKILEKVKGIAEAFLKAKVTDAVVTVPASFNEAQRQTTIEAGSLAGFDTVHLINEPTAVAIAYAVETRPQKKSNILVYSLGGGSFDVSVVEIEGLNIQVLSTSGDPCMGGIDLDMCLVELALGKNKDSLNFDRYDKLLMTRLTTLRSACEKAKRNLIDTSDYFLVVNKFYDDKDFIVKISTTEFKHICDKLFRSRSIEKVAEALKRANLDKKDINQILLVGGSTYIPTVREVVQELFPDTTFYEFGKLLEPAVRGAAIQAAVIKCDETDIIQGLLVQDIIKSSKVNAWTKKRLHEPNKGPEEAVHMIRSKTNPIQGSKSGKANVTISQYQLTANKLVQTPHGTDAHDSSRLRNLQGKMLAKEQRTANTQSDVRFALDIWYDGGILHTTKDILMIPYNKCITFSRDLEINRVDITMPRETTHSDPVAEIIFGVNSNGILEVNLVKSVFRGQTKRVPDKCYDDPGVQRISKMWNELQEFRKIEAKKRDTEVAKTILEKCVYKLKHSVDDAAEDNLVSEEERKEVEDGCDQALCFIYENEQAEKTQFEEKLRSFREEFENLMHRLNI